MILGGLLVGELAVSDGVNALSNWTGPFTLVAAAG